MRDFLYSEIASIHRLTNLPEDPDLAIAAGRGLCRALLEPLQATFGRIAIRSAYRSPEVNAFGNAHGHRCASNAMPPSASIEARKGWPVIDVSRRAIEETAAEILAMLGHRKGTTAA